MAISTKKNFRANFTNSDYKEYMKIIILIIIRRVNVIMRYLCLKFVRNQRDKCIYNVGVNCKELYKMILKSRTKTRKTSSVTVASSWTGDRQNRPVSLLTICLLSHVVSSANRSGSQTPMTLADNSFPH